jgi:uncharacterized protein (DUF488 family)
VYRTTGKRQVRLKGSAGLQLKLILGFLMMTKSASGIDTFRIWTVGHSTRSAQEFIELILAHRIKELIDVRAFPTSRRFPHFNQSELSWQLSNVGIEYRHLPALGGRRNPSRSSKNTAWKNASFRAYADHMETDEFKSGINELVAVAARSPTVFMCAEALWWKCHRSLIADYLKANGLEVIHILGAEKVEIHPYTSAARIVSGKLSYEGLLGSH